MKTGQFSLLLILAIMVTGPDCLALQDQADDFRTIRFPSLDDLAITADLYLIGGDNSESNQTQPLIVLCHQAGWSRGEYREIAPRLNSMGFHCVAIDQRSGKGVNEVDNETARRATAAGKPTNFVDAEQDMIATLRMVRAKKYTTGKILLWGSSYSSALALRIAGEHPDLVDGVLAFAPGEYFGRFGKPADWIAISAKKIQDPAFITSAKNEYRNWSAIFESIPVDRRFKFLPRSKGNHGSRALWKQFDDSPAYWSALDGFLKPFLNEQPPKNNQAKTSPVRRVSDIAGLPKRIAFGSCSHQNKPQPVLETVVAKKPDLFIYLGDNIYGDTKDMRVLKEKYAKLGAKDEFRKLRQNVPVLSVWDDHDYGWNDAGKEYEFKSESRELFLDFWQVPDDSPRRKHEGIYGSHRFEANGRSLQIILLDTRTFRDLLKLNPKPLPDGSTLKNAYQPDDDPAKTMLGEAQWKWLGQQLRQPADVRIICSSIQFGHEYNGWESWTNFPAEQERMVQLIRETGAGGVLFISGDVHWAEISKRQFDDLYPVYDVTASGLTEEWHNVEPNRFRVGEAWRDNHFGVIDIDWSTEVRLTLQIIDVRGNVQLKHELPLIEINAK